MLRIYSRMIAFTAMLVGLPTAQAADTTLTLACKGTTTAGHEGANQEPLSMGIIVNFTNRTVQGFGSPGIVDYPVKITAWNEVTVSFYGSDEKMGLRTRGAIDRVTGDVDATSMPTTRRAARSCPRTNGSTSAEFGSDAIRTSAVLACISVCTQSPYSS
jgi:hypothetical protein